MSPDFGPGGVGVTFDNTADVRFDEESHVRAIPQNHGGYGQSFSFDMGLASQDVETVMLNAGMGVQTWGAGRSRLW